jgi:hypothetical protein
MASNCFHASQSQRIVMVTVKYGTSFEQVLWSFEVEDGEFVYIYFLYVNHLSVKFPPLSMYIYRRTILKLNRKITARQIKRFKVLYSSFFSLNSDILQAISVSKYKN